MLCEQNRVTTDVETISTIVRNGDVLTLPQYIRGAFLGDLVMIGAEPFEEWRLQYHSRLFGIVEQALADSLARLTTRERNIELLRWSPSTIDILPNLRDVLIGPGEELGKTFAATSRGTRAEDLQSAPDPAFQPWLTPMVGRSEQMRLLIQAWWECREGKTQFVVVEGNAGHGKTRLVSEFIASLTEPAKIIRVRCYESERRVGYGPITDMLSQSVIVDGLQGLEPVWSGALRDLAPGLPTKSDNAPTLSAAASQSRLFEAIIRLLIRLGDAAPCLLFIDDIQWCDRSSQTLFSYLSHRLTNARCMLIVCMRSRTKNQSHKSFAEWRHIKVGELEPADLSILVRELERTTGWPSNLNAKKLARHTGGHPYLVAEVASAATSRRGDNPTALRWNPHTTTVDQFVSALLRSISGPAQRIIAVLAVLARPASPRLIRRIARLQLGEKSFDDLVDQELITVSQGRVALKHDLIREAAYRRIPMFTRTELHRRAAEALRHSTRYAGETALHYYKARERTLAFEYSKIAVAQADVRHATDESIFFVRLALRARPNESLDLRIDLAERLYRAHRLSAARTELRHVLNGKVHSRDQRLTLELLDLEIGYSLGEINGTDLRRHLSAFKQNAQHEDNSLLLRAMCLELRSGYHDGIEPVIAASLDKVRALAADDEHPNALEALTLAARVKSVVYSSTSAQQWVASVRNALPQIEDHEVRFRIMGALGDIDYNTGKLVEAEVLERATLDGIKQVGAMNMWPLTASHVHMLLVEQGRYDEARVIHHEARNRAGTLESVHTVATLCGNHASMLFEVGDLDGARECIKEGLECLSRVTSVWIQVELRGLEGLIALEQGRLQDAKAAAEFGKQKLDQLGMRVGDLSRLEILIARTDTLLGNRKAAEIRLRDAIYDYRDRDVVCRLRMQLELARMLKTTDKAAARQVASDVFTMARSINARPIAERAESLLQLV